MTHRPVRLGPLLWVAWLCTFLGGLGYAQGARVVPPSTLDAILARPLPTPASGASQADVTVVEYFDYDCPVCRRIEPELRKLLASYPRVRLVHKDWPVFGEASVYASYCTFAAAREGKYRIAHDALITSKPDLESREAVQAVLRAVGFDVKKLDADIALHEKEYGDVLSRNQREAAALGLRGTPGLIVGNQLVPGAIDYAQLEQLVTQVSARH
jgi:protein-disulfide isomerase